MKAHEVAPGIIRIESDLGPRFTAQYLLIGTERTVVVDTGLAHTPDEALAPAIAAAGAEPDLILITHADVDHCGGNRRMRELYPRAIFACPESDRRWVESNATMLAENYVWHAPYGLEQPDQQQLLTGLGGDAPIELGLRGGETIRLGRRRDERNPASCRGVDPGVTTRTSTARAHRGALAGGEPLSGGLGE